MHKQRHQLKRLRELSSTVDELTQLNAEHENKIQQQRVYCKRMEEQWGAMEDGMRALASSLQLQLPAADAAVPAASSGSVNAASILLSSSNPILRMLSTRWSALTGKEFKSVAPSAQSGDDAMTDEGADEADDAEDDDAEAGAARKSQAYASKLVALDEALQSNLQQRGAFALALLTQLVQHIPAGVAAAPASAEDPTAQVLSLQSERLSLQQRLHTADNEVALLTASLLEKEESLEAQRETNRLLLRRVERQKVDMEIAAEASSAAATAAAAGGAANSSAAASSAPAAAPRTGMVKADTVMLDSVPDTRPLSPTSLSFAGVPPPSVDASGAPLPSPASKNSYTDDEFFRLKQEVLEQRKAANRLRTELTDLREHLSKQELESGKSILKKIEDESYLKTHSAVVARLVKQNETHEMKQKNMRADMEQRIAEKEQAWTMFEAARNELSLLEQHVQSRLSDQSSRYESSLSQLSLQITSLQGQNSDLQLSLASHADYRFYAHLRDNVLPKIEETLKAHSEMHDRAQNEKKAVAELQTAVAAAATATADGQQKQQDATAATTAIYRQLGCVLRGWKEQERKLRSERDALSEEVSALRSAPSAALAPTAVELSQLRVSLSSVRKELDASRAELAKLSALPGDVSALRSELSSQAEMVSALSEELNTLTESSEAAAARATSLATQAHEGNKILDRLRSERQLHLRKEMQWKKDSDALKAIQSAVDAQKELQTRALTQAKLQLAAVQKAAQAQKDAQTALAASVDSARAAANAAATEAAEARARQANLAQEHSHCQHALDAAAAKVATAQTAARGKEEAESILKSRVHQLEKSLKGGAKGSSSSSSSSSASLDEARIRSLQLRLNCKVCEVKPKDRVITKCMHAICHECVEKNLAVTQHRHTARQATQAERKHRTSELTSLRLLCFRCAQTRLRKCPTCGVKFGDNDVRTLYL